MTPSPLLDDADLEAEVRAMLARRSADVTAARPRVPAEVVLHAGGRSARPPARRRTWAAAVASAAAAAVVVAGLVATVGGGSHRDRATTADDPASEDGDAGGGGMAVPPPVWPVVGNDALPDLVADPGDLAATLATPEGAAAAYLAEVAPAATAGPPSTHCCRLGAALVPWSFSDGEGAPAQLTGTISLRDEGTAQSPLWVVVGARTDGLSVGGFRGDHDSLQFTVEASGPVAEHSLSVRVGVDGEFRSVGAEALPQGSSDPDPAAGELVTLGADGRMTVVVPAGADAEVEILVRAVGGTFMSTSHVGLELPTIVVAPAPEAPEALEPVPTEVPPVDDPTPAPEVPAGARAVQVSGNFQGVASYTVGAGDCDLDHVLDSTFTLTDGTTWAVHATYCGVFEGSDRWRGTGAFTAVVGPTGDTLTGRLVSSAAVPTDGEPYTLEITGGTGAYDGATGSCTLDNHLVETGAGTQSHWGDFACAITP
jgi:hypothetical protein